MYNTAKSGGGGMNYHTLTAEVEAESNVLLSRWAALRMPVDNEWGWPALAAENAAPTTHSSISSPNQKRKYTSMMERIHTVDEFMLSLNIGDYSVDEDNVAGEWLCFLDHWLSEASSHTVSYLSTN